MERLIITMGLAGFILATSVLYAQADESDAKMNSASQQLLPPTHFCDHN